MVKMGFESPTFFPPIFFPVAVVRLRYFKECQQWGLRKGENMGRVEGIKRANGKGDGRRKHGGEGVEVCG